MSRYIYYIPMDKLIPLSEYAEKHGITQKAAYLRYKADKIPAKKIGRNIFYIEKALSPKEKKFIDQTVDRSLKEYGETLKKLGDE